MSLDDFLRSEIQGQRCSRVQLHGRSAARKCVAASGFARELRKVLPEIWKWQILGVSNNDR